MSYTAHDAAETYLGDVASGGGWATFRRWARGRGKDRPALATLLRYGWAEPGALIADLNAAGVAPGDAESTRQTLLAVAHKAQDVLIISDGASGEDDPEGVPFAVAKYIDFQERIYAAKTAEDFDALETEAAQLSVDNPDRPALLELVAMQRAVTFAPPAPAPAAEEAAGSTERFIDWTPENVIITPPTPFDRGVV